MKDMLQLEPKQEYTLILTGEEVVKLIGLASKSPWEEVSVLMSKSIEQLNQQVSKQNEVK